MAFPCGAAACVWSSLGKVSWGQAWWQVRFGCTISSGCAEPAAILDWHGRGSGFFGVEFGTYATVGFSSHTTNLPAHRISCQFFPLNFYGFWGRKVKLLYPFHAESGPCPCLAREWHSLADGAGGFAWGVRGLTPMAGIPAWAPFLQEMVEFWKRQIWQSGRIQWVKEGTMVGTMSGRGAGFFLSPKSWKLISYPLFLWAPCCYSKLGRLHPLLHSPCLVLPGGCLWPSGFPWPHQ